jgi:hypothetical protein
MKKLFVHIPKNGGTSLRQKRKDFIVNDYKKHRNVNQAEAASYLNPLHLKTTFGHIRLRDFDQPTLNTTQPFCIVRNPWSREVSKYKFLLASKKENTTKTKNRRELLKKYGQTFKDYFKIREMFQDVPYTWLHAVENFWPQIEYMTINDEVKCDVLRFEHYDEDLNKYMGITGLPHRNKMTQDDYRTYYDDELIQLVADIYKKDIDYFGFDFDSSAMRNFWE